MRPVIEIDRAIHPVYEFFSMLIQKVTDVQRPFLKMHIRQKRAKHRFDAAMCSFVFSQLSSTKLFLQCRDMVNDLTPPRRQICRKCRVDRAQFAVETIKLRVYDLFDLSKCSSSFAVKEFVDDLRQKRVQSFEKIGKRYVIAFHGSSNS